MSSLLRLTWISLFMVSNEKKRLEFDHGRLVKFYRRYDVDIFCLFENDPAGNYLLKVNNRSIRTRCGICLKLTIKIPERRHWRRSGIFIVNFEHILHLVLVFLLLTFNMKLPAGEHQALTDLDFLNSQHLNLNFTIEKEYVK